MEKETHHSNHPHHKERTYFGYTKRQLTIALVTGGILSLISFFYVGQYRKAQENAFNLDAVRGCDLAKIQFALEKYYEVDQVYPNDLYSGPFNEFYSKYYKKGPVPKDPQASLEYAYDVTPPDQYVLGASLSNGKTVKHDPSTDFPGKNISIKKGKPVPVDKSHYEVPCSLLDKN